MAAGVAALLSVVFLIRFAKTRKFMPAGTMLLLSVAAAAITAYRATRMNPVDALRSVG